MQFSTSDFAHPIHTDKAERELLRVEILTDRFKLLATLHIIPGTRLTDYLTRSIEGQAAHFLPLTDVKFHNASNDELLYERRFIELNIKQILWISPLENPEDQASP